MSSSAQLVEVQAPTEAATPSVSFGSGLPGFPGTRQFALVRWGASEGPYSVLVDLADPQVRFLVVPPAAFFPYYSVDLDDVICAALELDDADECLLLVIVTLGARAEDATANLLGPLVINVRNRKGMQAVLSDSGYGTRVPLAPRS